MISQFKHLLPRSRAWLLTTDKPMRQFFDGLSSLLTDSKAFSDDVLFEQFPQETSLDSLTEYEKQFGLPSVPMIEQARRDRLTAEWKALGGQSPRYIQDTLQAAGFDVYVHEWWQLPLVGSPVARNPTLHLRSAGALQTYAMNDGDADAQDGDPVSQDGASLTPKGYPLVNKVIIASQASLGDGSPQVQDGDTQAQDGSAIFVFTRREYTIPTDPTKWPFFLYIGGVTFPETANVLQSRKDEFEDLCLKICPTEQWLGILVEYN